MNATTATTYQEWAAEQRFEEGAGLSDAARVAALIAQCDGVLHRRAVRRHHEADVRARRDAREQFLARMEAL